MVSLSIIAACFGRYSHSRTPGRAVAIVPNGPRISRGASGLGSHVSMWLGPPVIHNRITLLLPAHGLAAGGRDLRSSQQARQGESADARQTGLEHAAAANDREALALACIEKGKGVRRRVLMHGGPEAGEVLCQRQDRRQL